MADEILKVPLEADLIDRVNTGKTTLTDALLVQILRSVKAMATTPPAPPVVAAPATVTPPKPA